MNLSTDSQNLPLRRFLSGPKVVASMFAMGIIATGLLYGYWTLHLMPFMPLQEAIVAEFPGSAPRVDGGQKKMHMDTPRILRIQMKTAFDPLATDQQSQQALAHLQQRMTQLVDEKVDFPDVRYIELHLYKLLQEKEIRGRSFRKEAAGTEWVEMEPEPSPLSVGPATVRVPVPPKEIPAEQNSGRNPETSSSSEAETP